MNLVGRNVTFEARDGRRVEAVVKTESAFGIFALAGDNMYYVSKDPQHAAYAPVMVKQ